MIDHHRLDAALQRIGDLLGVRDAAVAGDEEVDLVVGGAVHRERIEAIAIAVAVRQLPAHVEAYLFEEEVQDRGGGLPIYVIITEDPHLLVRVERL